MESARSRHVPGAIGNTPLVELRRVVPFGAARVVAKVESANPTGSMKDRVARAMVERAAEDGRLPSGGTLVEYTAGTTGASLAFVCAALGYTTNDAKAMARRLAREEAIFAGTSTGANVAASVRSPRSRR